MTFWSVFTFVIFILRVAGLYLAADAVMRTRTPQGTIAWIVALLFIPELSVWFYLVFGSRRFEGYVRARRRGRGELGEITKRIIGGLAPAACPAEQRPSLLNALTRLAVLPPTLGNRVEIINDAAPAFEAIFRDIDAATASVVCEYYIIRDDEIGKRFADRLIAARGRGVYVALIYDAIGCSGLSADYLDRLRAGGVAVNVFRARRAPWRRYQLNFRNHRKIVAIDGRIAHIGGINVGDEYLGKHKRLTPWRDTNIRVEGPAAQAAQLAWLEDWFSATGKQPGLPWPTPGPVGESNAGANVLFLPTGPVQDLESATLMFNHLFASATKRLWIATPYFVPDEGTLTNIQLAALRGVDVRVVVPQNHDVHLVHLSSLSFVPALLNAGVRIFRYQPGFMHQKAILVDDACAIGTANLDNRSMRINFEITALVHDHDVAEQCAAAFEEDFKRCHGVGNDDFTKRPWRVRFISRIARLLAPIQ